MYNSPLFIENLYLSKRIFIVLIYVIRYKKTTPKRDGNFRYENEKNYYVLYSINIQNVIRIFPNYLLNAFNILSSFITISRNKTCGNS